MNNVWQNLPNNTMNPAACCAAAVIAGVGHKERVPTGMDARSFARMVGADRIVKITGESGSASWLPSVPSSGAKPGGVTQDMSHAHVDLGNWPVMTTFTLFYKAGHPGEEGHSKGGE